MSAAGQELYFIFRATELYNPNQLILCSVQMALAESKPFVKHITGQKPCDHDTNVKSRTDTVGY